MYHTQLATNKIVALSFLFDEELEHVKEGEKLPKTCFVESFRVSDKLNPDIDVTRVDGQVEIPLREFIQWTDLSEMVFYHGSLTEPDCRETVSWIINMKPTVITKQQKENLAKLLSPEVQAAGGNYRDIIPAS